jgi:hypothetical protein
LTGKYNNGLDPEGRLGHPDKIKDQTLLRLLIQKFFGSEEEMSKTLNCLQEFGKLA